MTPTLTLPFPDKAPGTFIEIRDAVKSGCGLLMVPNEKTDRVRFTLARAGQRAPYWLPDSPAIAVQRRCGAGMPMPDGTTLFMQTTKL